MSSPVPGAQVFHPRAAFSFFLSPARTKGGRTALIQGQISPVDNDLILRHTMYDSKRYLLRISDESIDLSLDSNLRKDILSGKCRRRLENLTIKMDLFKFKPSARLPP